MNIQTEAVQLRHFIASDLAVVYQIGCEKGIAKQLNMPPFQSEHEAQSFLTMLQSDEHSWAIVSKKADAVCGLMMLAPNLAQDDVTVESYELSFAILPQYQRQGLMTSSLSAVMNAYHDDRILRSLWRLVLLPIKNQLVVYKKWALPLLIKRSFLTI
ncbi:GNAT family N-acetyltransferase [Latilactobacillus sakei]